MLGGLFAALLLFMGIGLVLWAKWLMPEEEVIQDRHDEPSTEEDKLMTEATLLGRRSTTPGCRAASLILRTLGLAGGAFVTVPLVALVGGMIKKPGDQLLHTLYRPNKKMFPQTGGRVPIVYYDFRQVSPDDLEPGSHRHRVPRRARGGRERLQRRHVRVVADDHHPAAARAR